MSIEFRDVSSPVLKNIHFSAPGGTVIGVVGEKSSGVSEFLKLAAGLEQPSSGAIDAPANRRYVGGDDPVSPAPVDLLLVDHALSRCDAVVRARTLVSLDRLRRTGATILIASHEEALLEPVCDEIIWLHEGRIAARGDARSTLNRYRAHVAARLAGWGEQIKQRLEPVARTGDESASVESVQLQNAAGTASSVWPSGGPGIAMVHLRFHQDVEEAVVGLIVRSRIGLEVYGANSRVAGVRLGPVKAGAALSVRFDLQCELMPGVYTITVALQNPDGSVRDWLEDAVQLIVAPSPDSPGYGVANLHARVSVVAAQA